MPSPVGSVVLGTNLWRGELNDTRFELVGHFGVAVLQVSFQTEDIHLQWASTAHKALEV